MGYKYYETRHDTDPSYDYDAEVVYPFGHGLSYTTFDKKIMAMNVENGVVTVRVEVTNTGDVAGKDVLAALSILPTPAPLRSPPST